MKDTFGLHDVHAGTQAGRSNVAAFDWQEIAALFHAPFNSSGNALMAADCESGKVERADDVLADGTFGKPLYEWMPALGKGSAADVAEFVSDVVATSQHTAQDEGVRNGRPVLVKDVLAARLMGKFTMSYVCTYRLNLVE